VRDLLGWTEARALADGQWLGYQWDDPEIVPLEKCRYDVGLQIPFSVTDEALRDGPSVFEFPPFRVAEVEIDGGLDLEMCAIDWLFGTWLPKSGYTPAHQPMFEAWNGRPFAHGPERFSLRIQLPVVDARKPL
jgi:AraC family transcriptional regulator